MPLPPPQTSPVPPPRLPSVEVLPFALLRAATRSYQDFVRGTQDVQLATWVLSQYADGLAEQALAAKSPSLLAALRRSQQSALELDPDVLTALHRYAVRASTRATPLMLFAGIATSPVGEFLGVRLPDWSRWDVGVYASGPTLLTAGGLALTDATARTALQLRIEETGILRGGVFCYFTEKTAEGAQVHVPHYKTVCLRVSNSLRALLGEPGRTWGWEELTHRIHELSPKTDPATIASYVQSLTESGVLSHDLQAPALGQRPEAYVAQVVAQRPALAALAEASQALGQLTAEPLPLSSPRLASLWSALASHPFAHTSGPPADNTAGRGRPGTVGQAILRVQGLQGGLPREPLLQLGHCIQAMPFLWTQPNVRLRSRLTDLLAQGTVGSRVPLLELLYRLPELGFAAGVAPPNLASPALNPDPQQTALEAYLRDKLWAADLSQQATIELDATTAEAHLRTPAPWTSGATQMESMVRLLSLGGRPTVCHYYSTSLLGRLLNRFLHWDAQEPLLQQLRVVWAQQEQSLSPAVVAEITGGGGGRVRDISLRPLTYGHQIVVDGPASVPRERQIHPHELSVFLDDSGPVLWWEKQQVPVIPRQLSALGLPSFSPVVWVLLALDSTVRHWSFALPAQGLPVHTARVVYKDVVLSPQTWLLPPSLQSELRKPRKERDEPALCKQLAAWRERYQVPRVVRLGDMEHNAVDLAGPMALSELAGMVEDGLVRVQEEFFHEDSLVHGATGPLVAEAVVHLQLASDPSQSSAGDPAGRAPTAASVTLRPPQVRGQLETSALRSEHVFYPGSAWLYLKLYHGPGLGSEAATRTFLDEDLLARFIAPLIAELEATQQLADFHFVRYADPEAHLRLRLRPAGQTALQLLDRLAPRLQQQGDARAFARYTLDTYEREVDRYGGSALIASAERLFTADSRLCLRLLTAAHRDRIETETDQHMLLPIYTLHTLLSGFGLDLPARERALSRLRQRRLPPERLRPEQKTVLDTTYRRHASQLQELVRHHEAEPDARPPTALLRRDLQAAYAEYRSVIAEVASAYRQAEAEGRLSVPLAEIVESLFHMHCNRLLGSPDLEARVLFLAQRSAEAVLARRRAAARRPAD